MPRLFEYDKIGHFVLYLVFSVLLIKSFLSTSKNLSVQNAKLIVLFLTAFIGGLIEILQANFIKNRNGDISDFIADLIGSLLGLLIYNYLAKRVYKLI